MQRKERKAAIMDNTTVKVIDVINDLIESNEKNYSDGTGVYLGGYLDGYHDALVDVLNQMRIENYHTYYN